MPCWRDYFKRRPGKANGTVEGATGLRRIAGCVNLIFVAQAMAGHDLWMLTVTIGVENFTGGMGTAAFVAYLSSLTNIAFTATQFALLSSFMAFGRTILSSGGGWVTDHIGWIGFFFASTAIAVPGLILLLVLMRMFPPPLESGRNQSSETGLS